LGWTIEFIPAARKQLYSLDRSTAACILAKLESWLSAGDPRSFGEPLRDRLKGYWRWRVGDYRVIAEVDGAKLLVLVITVGHRREIYR
jgi:mRNA interferase RelE/StbE